jgi:hypothetical protein
MPYTTITLIIIKLNAMLCGRNATNKILSLNFTIKNVSFQF